MRILPMAIFLILIGCGKNYEIVDDNLSNAPGGAYGTSITLTEDSCNPEPAKLNEWVWTDVWPENNDREYRLVFWKFDFKKVRIYDQGEIQDSRESNYFPRLIEFITTGHIANRKIDLLVTVNFYDLDADNRRALVCGQIFTLIGEKFLNYPSPPPQ